MAFDLSSIKSGRESKPPRVIIASPEKIGKSTFAAAFPDPILLPIVNETGIDEIDGKKAPVSVAFKGANSILEKLEWLATAEHEFKTVVIDSLTTLEPLVHVETCKRYGVDSIELVLKGFGKGYIEACTDWRDLQAPLDYLRDNRGIGCVLTTHIKLKKFNDPMAAEPYDAYTLSLNDLAAEQLSRWADCVLFANIKTYSSKVGEKGGQKIVHATGNGERKLYTEKRGSHPGGCRRSLPYELPFTYAAFADAYAKASAGVPK
jgi:hypothetical protein